MRLLELALHRYGAFTDRVVPLGPGLTLITGGNEAGKSTALDAVSSVLWGIPRGASADFLHGRPALALGARVAVGGREHHLRRDSRTLTVEGEAGSTPFEAPWAGAGDTAARWRTSFGLSHAELRAGGQALCAGAGDLAELIFTARHGARLGTVLAEVGAEADALWKPHGNARSVEVRKAAREHADAVARAEQATGRAALVAEAREATLRAEQEADRAEERRVSAASAHARLVARQSAFAHSVRLAVVEAALGAVAGPRLSSTQSAVVSAAREAAQAARAQLGRVQGTLDDARQRLAALTVDEALLADAEAVRALVPHSGARAEDAARAAVLRDEAAAHRRESAEALSALGEGKEPARVPVGVAADLDSIAAELLDAERIVAKEQEAVAAAEQTLAQARQGGPELPLDAVAAVAEAARAVRADGSATQVCRAAAVALTEQEHARSEALAEAGAASGLPPSWPEPDVRARAAAEVASAGELVARAEREVARLSDELAGLADAGDGGGDGEAERRACEQARGERTELLDELLAAWSSGTPVAEQPRLAGRLSRAVERADAAADVLLRGEAERARAGEAQVRAQALRTALEGARAGAEHATAVLHGAEQAWAALWPGVAVPAPARADTVAGALARARAADLEVQRLHAVRRQQEPAVAEQREGLRAALAAASRPRPGAALDALLEAADELVRLADDARDQRTRAQAMTDLLEQAKARLEGALGVRAEVQDRWSVRSDAAGLPTGTGPAGWRARQEAVTLADSGTTLAATAEAQAEEAEGRWATHLAAVQALATRHACPPTLAPAAALTELAERLLATEIDDRSRTDLQRRAAEALAEQAAAEEALAECVTHLTTVADEAGLACDDEEPAALEQALAEAAERGAQERALLREQEQILEAVGLLVPGVEPRALAAGLAEEDPDALAAEVAAAAEQLAGAEQARRQADERLGERRREQRESESAEGAAVLHAQAAEAAAAVAVAAERWVVAEVQRQVLGAELAEYEAQHASPLLASASTLLADLTGGRFTGLVRSRTSTERELLVVRADGEHLGTAALSEGTADQVFLALRLAGIGELQAERVERGLPTLPVVLDDVLMTFDDRRATAALEVLATLSERWQVIVLSHHQHLAGLPLGEAARARVTLTRLPAPGDTAPSPAPAAPAPAPAAPAPAATTRTAKGARRRGADGSGSPVGRSDEDDAPAGVLFAVD